VLVQLAYSRVKPVSLGVVLGSVTGRLMVVDKSTAVGVPRVGVSSIVLPGNGTLAIEVPDSLTA
jgi:hypothetical protein